MKNSKNYITLAIWIASFILIGAILGWLTKTDVNTWYKSLNRSSLTPPDYIFPVAWTILYILIAISGWKLFRTSSKELITIKSLYILQMILNWCWTPLFFRFNLTGYAFISLLVMDISLFLIVYLGYKRIKTVSLLMTPYLIWILFATYLNFYVWQYN